MQKPHSSRVYTGLSPEQVAESRAKHGENRLTPPRRPSMIKLYLEKFNDPIVRILLVAAAASLAIAFIQNEFAETIGILIAIFLSTGIAFYFERDAALRFDELNKLGEEEPVSVVREGSYMRVPQSQVVVGDVVVIEQGMEIPADGRLLEAHGLQVNESTLTGEPICKKTTDPDKFNPDATFPDNMVLRSTFVTEGSGMMKVEKVGDATEIGQVQHESLVFINEPTPLGRQLNSLAALISRIAFAVAALAFVAFSAKEILAQWDNMLPLAAGGWIVLLNILLQNFMMAVTLIVMAVPEGLPMAITLSLALNMRRMLGTNNLVRRLHASETMGAINVICTDKTGTLTENKMKIYRLDMANGTSREQMAEAIAVNSTANLSRDGQHVGNPTECALLEWTEAQGFSYSLLREQLAIAGRLPFSPELKYMATLASPSEAGAGRVLYVKGAPEAVLPLCTMGEGERAATEQQLKLYQQRAMRTLCFASRTVDKEAGDCAKLLGQGGLTYMGTAAISDPVRPEVPQAVAKCQKAGIRIIVVTGDNLLTAKEVARQAGLWNDGDGEANTISGADFARLSDDEASSRLDQLKIMSRARPLDKQRLVALLKKQGNIVAVTGDGTNDAPALNTADVGLAMGSGTSVAKEAGDITLLDDSFRSIATAVMWGRSIYKNIQRFLIFQLTINLVALLTVIAGACVGHDLPLTVTQMLWINLIMDTFAAMALAAIPPEPDVMSERPRRHDEFILTKPVCRSILSWGLLFFVALLAIFLHLTYSSDADVLYEQTIFFTLFVLLQFWNLLNAKAFGSNRSALCGLRQCKGLLWVQAFILIGQVMIVEFGGRMFRTTPLALSTWVELLLVSSLTLWVGEAARFINRKRKQQ